MNPENQPRSSGIQPQSPTESGCGVLQQNVIQPSGCGILPQSVQGASLARHSESADGCSVASSPDSSPTPQPPERSNATHFNDDMGFVDPPETRAEPDYGDDYDYEDEARERELLMADLADYNEDF